VKDLFWHIFVLLGYASENGQRLLNLRPSVIYVIATDWVTGGCL